MPISGKEMCKLFLKLGYELIPGGGKGSHMRLRKDGFPSVTIPHHKELRIGMEHALKKTLKLVKEDLE